jgi:hypothetical protein
MNINDRRMHPVARDLFIDYRLGWTGRLSPCELLERYGATHQDRRLSEAPIACEEAEWIRTVLR